MSFVHITGAFVVRQSGYLPYLYLATLGADHDKQICILDIHSPATGFTVLRTRSFDGSDNLRNRRKRAKRVTVWGRGTLTGGLLIVVADGIRWEAYPLSTIHQHVERRILVQQEVACHLVGYQMDYALVLSGTGLETWDHQVEYAIQG